MTGRVRDVATPTLSARGRALLESNAVSFDADGIVADGQRFDFDWIDGYHVAQRVVRKQDMHPLSWLVMLAGLFLFIDLAVTNIDGVFYLVIFLALVGLIAYFSHAPGRVEIVQTSLVLTMDGRPTVVLCIPPTDLEAFSFIQAELSRLILIHARQREASLT